MDKPVEKNEVEDIGVEAYKIEEISDRLKKVFLAKHIALDDKVNLDLRQEEMQKEIDTLISEKSKFKHVFKTDRGSIYFQTNDGVARVQNDKNGYWKFQFVKDNIFYIPKEDAEELLEMLEIEERNILGEHLSDEVFARRAGVNSEYLCNKPISIDKIELGMYPLDFGFGGVGREIGFIIKNNKLIIKGNNNGHLGGSAIHIGDKIVEIIK